MALTLEKISVVQADEGQNLRTSLGAVGDALKLTVTKVTFDSSYPTGGEAVVAADFGLTTLREVIAVLTIAPVAATKTVLWDRANSKLTISAEDGTSGVNADAANGSDQSAVIALVTAIGK